MIFANDRQQLRNTYITAWQKFQANQFLEPLEAEIVAVINDHPEYHSLFNDPITALQKDFSIKLGETNPFLHLSLHLAIREQIKTDRPAGIFLIYQQLATKISALAAEHKMLEVLAECLWEMQRTGIEMKEEEYLEKIRRLV